MKYELRRFWEDLREWLLDFFHGPASGEKNNEQLTPKKFDARLSPKWEAVIEEAKMAKPKKKPKKRKKTKTKT